MLGLRVDRVFRFPDSDSDFPFRVFVRIKQATSCETKLDELMINTCIIYPIEIPILLLGKTETTVIRYFVQCSYSIAKPLVFATKSDLRWTLCKCKSAKRNSAMLSAHHASNNAEIKVASKLAGYADVDDYVEFLMANAAQQRSVQQHRLAVGGKLANVLKLMSQFQ